MLFTTDEFRSIQIETEKNKTFSARVNIESIYSMRMPAAVCVWKIWCSIVENSYNIIVEGVFDLRMWATHKLLCLNA